MDIYFHFFDGRNCNTRITATDVLAVFAKLVANIYFSFPMINSCKYANKKNFFIYRLYICFYSFDHEKYKLKVAISLAKDF